MEEVGVQAVVTGLQAFLGDMGKINSSINGLRPSGSLLQQMFEGVSNAVVNFGSAVARVVETALGVMLRDAIEGIIRSFGELIQSIIETGSELQLLQIRLTGLNLNEFADGTRSFSDAMALAGEKTQEELTWLMQFGAATPFDPAQIADTYTQARAFGFAADEAKRLTEDILNYTAGMGLSNDTLFLVIQNLGQMVQRGKITGTEIRDLARGSFLPLNDVLERIAKNMGMTVKELTKEISTPAGIPASQFVKAFEQMVEEEPRFIGAAGRLSRALVPAAKNVKELLTSLLGNYAVVPIFDILGEKIASFTDQFITFNEQGDLVQTGRWQQLVVAVTNLGTAISDVVQQMLGFLPSSESLADALINGIQGLALWIRENRENIIGFFRGIGDVIQNNVVPFIRDSLIPFFERIGNWVKENKETINGFFQSLGDIVGKVFGDLFGGKFQQGDFLGGLLEGIKTFMQFVTENKDKIAGWVESFLKIIAVVEILITVFNVVTGVIGAVIGIGIGFVGVLITIGTVLALILSPITWIVAALIGLGVAVVLTAVYFQQNFGLITAAVTGWYTNTTGSISQWATQTWQTITTWVANTWGAIVQWGINVWLTITTWATNTWLSIVNWAASVVTTVTGWKDTVLGIIRDWVIGFLLEVDNASGGSIGKFLYYTGATIQLISDWKDRQIEKFQEWATNTGLAITTWVDTTAASIATWATNTWTSIATWATNTWTSITTWVETTIASITDWATRIWTPIGQWIENTVASFLGWKDRTLKPVNDFSNETTNTFNTWKDKVLATLTDWWTAFAAKVDGFKKDLAKKFSDIGKAIMTALHDAIINSAAWVAEAAAEAAQRAYEAALAVFGIGSPSKVFLEMGANTMGALATGIEKYAAMASSAMTSAVSRVAMPALVAPSIIQSVIAQGAGNTSNNTSNRSYNLTVNSAARTEPIVQDFNMMQSLAG